MITWMFRRSVVLCAVLCVLLLFLFPIVHGPFPATHGPATVFRGRRAIFTLLLLIFSAATSMVARLKAVPAVFVEAFLSSSGGKLGLMQDPNLAVLRC